MNVLSLFDGMSCGRIALERAGIHVNNYYASEIDKYAIKISEKNYPDIIRLGDVTQIDFKSLKNIDLIIGGSPCQGFSFAGKQLNFDDPRSRLFFEFVRAIKECKSKYFMLENVSMRRECLDIISEYLGVKAIEINSKLVSAQSRKRFYWTNFNITPLEDMNKTIQSELGYKQVIDAIYTNRPARYYDTKAPTIRAARQGQTNEKGKRLTVNDYEILQTVPKDYTLGVSNTQRYKMLGNGWTVDVIVHILKQLREGSEK